MSDELKAISKCEPSGFDYFMVQCFWLRHIVYQGIMQNSIGCSVHPRGLLATSLRTTLGVSMQEREWSSGNFHFSFFSNVMEI